MFTQKIVRSSLALALVLAASSAAFAAPARGGYRNSVAEQSCTPAATTSYRDAAQRTATTSATSELAKGTSGYRDAYARVPVTERSTRMVAAAPSCRM